MIIAMLMTFKMFVSQNLIIFIDTDNNKHASTRSVQSILYEQSICNYTLSKTHYHRIGQNSDNCNQKQLKSNFDRMKSHL
jgi:hypothetical protein